MKTSLSIFILVVCWCKISMAQTAGDLLERGIKINSDKKVFFYYNQNQFKVYIGKSLSDRSNPPSFIPVKDSTVYMIQDNGVNLYMKPVNPLNYSYNSVSTLILDQVRNDATSALGAIADILGSVMKPPTAITDDKIKKIGWSLAVPSQKKEEQTFKICDAFAKLEAEIKNIKGALETDKKAEITDIFKDLKALDFISEQETKDSIKSAEYKIHDIEVHFSDIMKQIVNTRTKVKNYECLYPEPFTTKYIFNDILDKLTLAHNEQKKRLDNLKNVYKLVKTAQQTASKGGDTPGLEWCFALENAVPDNKISVYTLSLKESGFKLSDGQEIIASETKDKIKKTLRFREFNRFIPEVYAGTAFTFIKYNTYGTTTDAAGQQFIGTPTENRLRNFNVVTMINFNYFIEKSDLHPFFQIGAGINTGIPALLTGAGVRINSNGLKRIAISGGIAMTWVKELDKLKVGDKVAGTDDIEKDLKYQFTWPPKPYIALQYKF
ncbi:hypothetical protein [Pedobacter punctiformis]|uniref:Uncharacterized protein n=1 Tax=Pedobacter punctiformis TaxID=3004097 RepID=A0ABT4LAZ9_9SPHI|nr:hypothetical protein [Pedobacter sp. HCMS5-2]MCZ4245106.1 hypothetical protein [Pedobacter sp. HCMS5-2]